MGRGQITVFILLGILILIAGILWFLPRESSLQKTDTAITDVEGTRATAQALAGQYEQCVKERAEEMLVLFGLEGGDLLVVERSPFDAELPMNNLYRRGENRLPSLQEWSAFLSNSLTERMRDCAQGLIPSGGTFEPSAFRAAVIVGSDDVIVSATGAGRIAVSDLRTELPEVALNIPIRLGRIHDVVQKVLGKLVENPNEIPYSTLGNLGFPITVLQKNETMYLYALEDPLSLIRGQSYNFVWGALYGAEKVSEISKPTILNGGETFTLKVGVPFSFTVRGRSAGGMLTYVDNTPLFIINSSIGVISFTPTNADIGMKEVEVSVFDKNGGETSASYLFLITP